MTNDCVEAEQVASPHDTWQTMQDAMQRSAPAAPSIPEPPSNASKPLNTSLQLATCQVGSHKSKATGHTPCTPSPELAEDENGLSTSSDRPETLVQQDGSNDQGAVNPEKPAKPGMGAAMVRAAGVCIKVMQ